MILVPRYLKPRITSGPLNVGRRGSRSKTASAYVPNAVDFDGTNDYLTRGAGLDGAADSKLVSGGFWLNCDVDDTTTYIFTGTTTLGGSTLRWRTTRTASELIQIIAQNAAGTLVLNVSSTAGGIVAAGGWYNVLFSFDLADTGKRHLYIADASDLATVSTYTDDSIDFTVADWGIGALPSGGNKFDGAISEPWLAPGYYIDFSVEANRREFITAAGAPAKSPATALANLSVTAAIILEGDAAGFGTNTGNGGDFTITGSLDDTTPPP